MQKYKKNSILEDIFFYYSVFWQKMASMHVDSKVLDFVSNAFRSIDIVLEGKAFVDMPAACGKNADTAFDIVVDLAAGDRIGKMRNGGHVGVHLLGAAEEVDVDLVQINLVTRVVLELVFQVIEECLTGIEDTEAARTDGTDSGGAHEVDISGVAADPIVEPHHGLIAACIGECIPLYFTGILRRASAIEAELSVMQIGIVGGFCDRRGTVGCGFPFDERNRIGGDEQGAVGLTDIQDIGIVLVEPVFGVAVVEGHIVRSEAA
jgi:hypothetical protein